MGHADGARFVSDADADAAVSLGWPPVAGCSLPSSSPPPAESELPPCRRWSSMTAAFRRAGSVSCSVAACRSRWKCLPRAYGGLADRGVLVGTTLAVAASI